MKASLLKSGNYRVVISDGYYENGKRKFKSFTAPTESGAIKKAEDYLSGRVSLSDSKITLDKAMEVYIQSRENVLEKTTLRIYRQYSKRCFKCIHKTRLAALRPIDIQRAVNEESARVSAKYLKNAYGFLKSVLQMFEVDIRLESVRLPKLETAKKELPSFETVYDIVKGTDVELPVLLAAWLSLRSGEVVGLKFKDVDEVNNVLHVRRTIIQTDEGVELRERCKTEKSKRDIQIPDYILSLIKNTPHTSDEDFIVNMSSKALRSRFVRKIEKHGIKMTFHDLRSMNASVMLMLGVPDKYAMERGGWSTDSVLKSVYQRTFSTEREKNNDVINNYFNNIINKRGMEIQTETQ